LLRPDRALQHLAQVALGDGLAAGREAEGEDLGLDVGGEEEEVHDLGQAGAGQAVVTRDVSVVLELAAPDAGLDGGGLGQEAGDAGGVRLAQAGLAAGAALGALLAAGAEADGLDALRHDAASSGAGALAPSSGVGGSGGKGAARSWRRSSSLPASRSTSMRW